MTKQSKLLVRGMAVSVLLLLCIGLGLYVCRDKDDGLPKPPLKLPISLEQAGSKYETTFRRHRLFSPAFHSITGTALSIS